MWCPLKVRIKETPREDELDGVRLGGMRAGTIREVSSSIGWWLIAQRYAELEMRHEVDHETADYSGAKEARAIANDSPRRRSTDR
jgi:hypothetical protein